MFAGFNLITHEDFLSYKSHGDAIFNSNKKSVEEEFNKFMLDDGSINGSEMQSSWFPQINADIFLSHSHADKEKAIAFSGWLNKEFDLNVFIDSCVWGYADDLLKKIDDRFCKNPNDTTYNYEKRNFSTSHVHTMLSTALSMMIDKTECIIFINTPNSIETKDVINRTKSPWIYYEIGMTQLVRKKKPVRQTELIKKGYFEEAKALNIMYDLDINHLCEITQIDIENWGSGYRQSNLHHPLDFLYQKKKLLQYS